MSSVEILIRICAFAVIGCSLALARRLNGRGIDNIPFWTGIGMTFFYACYSLFGIRFANGTSATAELTVALLIACNTVFFSIGNRFAGATGRVQCAATFKRPLPLTYMWVLVFMSVGFYILLTQGQPWRIFTDSVGLKFERLQGIADKSPVLLNLDAFVVAMTMVAFSWTILVYRDDKRSRRQLLVTTFLLLLYVQSTGSRSPLLMLVFQAMPALAEATRRSKHMAGLARKKWLFASVFIGGAAFMIVTTASRVEVEALDQEVFRAYFRIEEFGAVGWLLEMSSAASFFLSTLIVYAASTFNNVVIRLQELAAITPSMGYRFVFFYTAASQILLPGFLQEPLASWRELGTINKDHLEFISIAAGQWATPYGDILWDFGVSGGILVTALFSFIAGYIIGNARRRPTFENVLLMVVVLGFTLLPLVNPLLSLYVHYELIILLFLVNRWTIVPRRRITTPCSAPVSPIA